MHTPVLSCALWQAADQIEKHGRQWAVPPHPATLAAPNGPSQLHPAHLCSCAWKPQASAAPGPTVRPPRRLLLPPPPHAAQRRCPAGPAAHRLLPGSTRCPAKAIQGAVGTVSQCKCSPCMTGYTTRCLARGGFAHPAALLCTPTLQACKTNPPLQLGLPWVVKAAHHSTQLTFLPGCSTLRPLMARCNHTCQLDLTQLLYTCSSPSCRAAAPCAS